MTTNLLMLLLVAFAGPGVVLYVFARQLAPKLSKAGMRPLLGVLGIGVLAGLLSGLLAWTVEDGFVRYWLLCAVFLAAGLGLFLLSHKRFTALEPELAEKLFLAEALHIAGGALVAVALSAAGIFFIAGPPQVKTVFLPAALFYLLPMLCRHLHRYLLAIPAAIYPVWQAPDAPIPLPDEKEGEVLLVIGFEIAKQSKDALKTYFRAKAPSDMALGDLYYHFVNDYNDLHSETPIDLAGLSQQPVEWWFWKRPKRFQRRRVLNPARSFEQNKLRENSVIVCERILTGEQVKNQKSKVKS